jgi:hypothetical protein
MESKTQKEKRIPSAEWLLLISSFSSILLALYPFFCDKNFEMAFFVGLWAPTLLGLINFINLKFK